MFNFLTVIGLVFILLPFVAAGSMIGQRPAPYLITAIFLMSWGIGLPFFLAGMF